MTEWRRDGRYERAQVLEINRISEGVEKEVKLNLRLTEARSTIRRKGLCYLRRSACLFMEPVEIFDIKGFRKEGYKAD